MPEQTRSYVAIDLKSFYASVECKERNLDPLTTNLVVADPERTTKTICLAVSPALKAYGIPGRARLFEVVRKVKEINDERKRKNGGHEFTGQSCDTGELKADRSFALDYITAVPRMALYMKYSTRIYDIYLKYVAPEDIHVYSIDEVFMDVTDYLHTYRLTPEELAGKIMREIYEQTGITATAGIGTNLYLAKIAMDIMAKHSEPDENGFRFASLDEMSYRRSLWNHRPLTDFWRVGRGYAKKLEQCGLYTMGDIARCSVGKENEFYNEELLYPQMSREDRAAQFAPFAALTGHKDAIRETERLTERKRRLSEDCRQILDLYLREVCQSQEPREVDFEYFVPDQKKEGGSYQKKSGCIRRIDTYLNEIVLQSGDRIPLDEIVDIDGVIAAADEV